LARQFVRAQTREDSLRADFHVPPKDRRAQSRRAAREFAFGLLLAVRESLKKWKNFFNQRENGGAKVGEMIQLSTKMPMPLSPPAHCLCSVFPNGRRTHSRLSAKTGPLSSSFLKDTPKKSSSKPLKLGGQFCSKWHRKEQEVVQISASSHFRLGLIFHQPQALIGPR